MVFNNVTDTLRLWCRETAAGAYEAYQSLHSNDHRVSPASLPWRAASALGFWLGSLTDAEFEDYSAYQSAVRTLLPVPVTPPLPHEMTSIERHYMKKTEEAFLDELASLRSDCPDPGLPYFRILSESEAPEVKARFREIWGFEENSYWYPLSDAGVCGSDALYVMDHILQPYLPALGGILGLPEWHMYCLAESWYGQPNCFETVELDTYGGSECAYAAKDFSWLIYCSHENTVTFAGSAVTSVKELLRKEKEHWNKYICH